MVIKILGSGCANCKRLEENAKKAVHYLKIDANIVKVKEYKDIMAYGVMRTPGLVINERVVSSGRVLTVDEIVAILQNN